MFNVFAADTADNLWLAAANHIKTDGNAALQRSRGGDTHEILHAAMELRDPRARWVASRHPPINIAFALAEAFWIIRGRNDSAFVNYFNATLPKFAGDGATYYGAYGFRLRHEFGIDQIERAYSVLRANGDTRQVVLQIWNSGIDLPSEDGIPSTLRRSQSCQSPTIVVDRSTGRVGCPRQVNSSIGHRLPLTKSLFGSFPVPRHLPRAADKAIPVRLRHSYRSCFH